MDEGIDVVGTAGDVCWTGGETGGVGSGDGATGGATIGSAKVTWVFGVGGS